MSFSVWQRNIVTEAGDVIPDAEIEVFDAGSSSKPDLFSDPDGNSSITNPFNADSNGFARFYVAGGRYDISVNGAVLWEDVALGTTQGRDTGSAPSEVPTNEIWEQKYLAQNGGTVPEVDQEEEISSRWRWSGAGPSIKRDGTGVGDVELVTDLFTSGTAQMRIAQDGDNTSDFIRFQPEGGLRVGFASGDGQGRGTLNAEELYENGNRVVTDYVFDAELDGDVDAAHYDALMGEREIDEGEDEDGNPKVRREKQSHRPAHAFRENTSELEPTEFAKRWRQCRKLPAMERCENSLREGQDRPSLGQTLQAVLETCEVQAVHIDRLEKRIEALEDTRGQPDKEIDA